MPAAAPFVCIAYLPTPVLQVIFADRSWILLRASGTEPKFRYYYEVVSDSPLPNDGAEVLNQYKEAASGILTAARAMV